MILITIINIMLSIILMMISCLSQTLARMTEDRGKRAGLEGHCWGLARVVGSYAQSPYS